jgi:hypothetical protein
VRPSRLDKGRATERFGIKVCGRTVWDKGCASEWFGIEDKGVQTNGLDKGVRPNGLR